MNIRFEQVTPLYLEPEKLASSEVWTRTFDLGAGEHLHIVAPSGRGKSSLIHFIYQMRSDYSGRILFDGRDIRTDDASQVARNRSEKLSVIFQDLRLFPEHSARQNLEVKWALYPAHDRGRIEEMAERLGIKGKLEKPARTCSYGEQQRIAIIRALQQPFDVLLMDEPFSHLDENNRHIAMELVLEEAEKRNASVILADLKKLDYFKPDRILHL